MARSIAHYGNADVERISAVTSGVKEIREAIERARLSKQAGRRTISTAWMRCTVSIKSAGCLPAAY
ncbi:hypothetical protein WDV93_16345 [Pantoea ananatis]